MSNLESLIIHLATQYENGEECRDFEGNLISDNEYDNLVVELKQQNPNSIIFDKITPATSYEEKKLVKHDPPMTSIEKCPSQIREEEFSKWLEKVKEAKSFVAGYKLDGLALRIYYQNGKLIKAGLRPRDGINGEDVTENVKYVKGIPQKIENFTFSISGELVCDIEDFNKINEKLQKEGLPLRSNPRNHASGAIRQFKDPKKTKDGKLSFVAYSIENFEEADKYYKTELERLFFAQKLGIEFIGLTPFDPNDFQFLYEAEEEAKNYSRELDGIVISVNELDIQEQLGRHGDRPTGAPRGKIAWKFKDQEAQATIKEITWQVGRTGKLTPVAIFAKSAYLAGTNVSRCTLNNLGWITRNSIGIGTTIKLIKSGSIIPKAIGIVSNPQNCEIPSFCPSCEQVLSQIDGKGDNKDLVCINFECPSKKVALYANFLEVLGIKGIGEAIISKLNINNYIDFFNLNIEKLQEAGLSLRQSLIAFGNLKMLTNASKIKSNEELLEKINSIGKITVAGWQFLASLGISGCGKTASKSLFDTFKTIERILEASYEEILAIEGIGPETAISIFSGLKENKEQILQLLNFIDIEQPKTGSLDGKIFCFSGSFEEGKAYWEKRVADLGGKITSSVGKKVSCLIVGDGSGLKSEKAKELGIKILSIEELKEMLK